MVINRIVNLPLLRVFYITTVFDAVRRIAFFSLLLSPCASPPPPPIYRQLPFPPHARIPPCLLSPDSHIPHSPISHLLRLDLDLAVALARHMPLQPAVNLAVALARHMRLQTHGVLCMSMGFLMLPFLMPAHVWRGPMVMAAVEKLVRGTDGVGDVLVVDVPLGTGDMQLRLSQQARLSDHPRGRGVPRMPAVKDFTATRLSWPA
ncbi:unnamed protein product [Closterium sp. NIES-65]|nr:unnamed protein product [Closterium sp. NIES-65]CAI5985874.1 unnamed protein product [Closterium sp. NIES-65]